MQIARYEGKSANNFMGNVVISPNLKKESVRINPSGDIIDKRTKEVIEPVAQEYVPPVQPLPTPTAPVQSTNDSMSVVEQIKQAKQRVLELEELKKLKIAEKKAEIELLEQ